MVLWTLFSLLSVAGAARFPRSLDDRYYWDNPNAVGSETFSTGETPEWIIPAIVADGPTIINGEVWLRDPRTGEWKELHEELFGARYPIRGFGPSGSGNNPPIFPVLPSSEALCTGATPGITCPWRTDWSVWACHPSTAFCVCPFQTTQDPFQLAVIRNVHWTWPANTTVNYRSYDPSRCPDATMSLPVPLDGSIATEITIPCAGNEGRICRPTVRRLVEDDRSNSSWPRLLGPQWMLDAFDPLSEGYHMATPAVYIAPRCGTMAYLTLSNDARRLTSSCSKNTATIFRVRAPVVPEATDAGVAFYADDATGRTLSLVGETVCWHADRIAECETGNPWRVIHYDTGGFGVADISTDTTKILLPVVFIRV